MARFKLSLIVPNNDIAFSGNEENEYYLTHIITDFVDQQTILKNQPIQKESTYNTQDLVDDSFELWNDAIYTLDLAANSIMITGFPRKYINEDYNNPVDGSQITFEAKNGYSWSLFDREEQWYSAFDVSADAGQLRFYNVTQQCDNPDDFYEVVFVVTEIKETIRQSTWDHPVQIAYTYNEKLSSHKNGQQELTFSIDDRVLLDDEWVENPFARILRTGVQLELQDKYNNRKLFTINKIAYGFNNVCITYNITCQDSFTYQLNKQNSGYELKNDETSMDFLGALSIDQWAQKVEKECYITYKYIPLWEGLYQDKDGYLYTYKAPSDGPIKYKVELKDEDHLVQKIIKPVYNTDDYPDFYETFPFSASGSSANAALISMAEELGLQLAIAEGLAPKESGEYGPGEPIKYARYFFFIPTKNPDVSGLTYSPLRDIQTFSLSFSGESLTTVLNVKSTTWEDEEIGLIPSVPPFFQSLFIDSDWEKTIYYPGFFLEAIKGKHYGSFDSTKFFSLPAQDAHIRQELSNQAALEFNSSGIGKWMTYYNKVCFYWEDREHYTLISGDTLSYNPYQSNVFEIWFETTKEENNTIEYTYTKYYQNEEISKELISKFNQGDAKAFLVIPWSNPFASPTFESCYFQLARDYTQEEENFARIAEECPWLENKLMDFSYFVRQGILSRAEYEGLMKWLMDDLRIINGQLICYADTYYHALASRVKIQSEIETSLDQLGAVFEADVIQAYTSNAAASFNLSTFESTYQSIFNKQSSTKKDTILNLNDLISDLFNKYFNAEQRFLKNMYDFRTYFENRNIFSLTNDTILMDVNYSLINDSNKYLFTFNNRTQWSAVTENSPIIKKVGDDWTGAYPVVPLYKNVSNKFIQQKIPYERNYLEFYFARIKADSFNAVQSQHRFNIEDTYYLKRTEYLTYFNIDTNDEAKMEIIEDRTIKVDNIQYVRLTRQEIIKIFLEQHNSSNEYYIRDTQLKVPFEWVRTNWSVICDSIQHTFLPGWDMVVKLNNIQGEAYDKLLKNPSSSQRLGNFYRAGLPVDNLYVYDYNLDYYTTVTNGDTSVSWTVNDKFNHPYKIKRINNNSYDVLQYDKNAPDHYITIASHVTKNSVKNYLYRQYFAVPYITYHDQISLITSSAEDTGITSNNLLYWIDLLGSVKNTKYFTCSDDQTAKAWALVGSAAIPAVACCTLVPFGWFFAPMASMITSYLVMKNGKWPLWQQKEHTQYAMPYFDGSDWTDYEENVDVDTDPALGTPTRMTGDSHFVNYTLAKDSFSDLKNLTEWWWNTSDELKLFDIIDSEDESKYKHYINYYQFIAATFRQGASGSHANTDAYDSDYNTKNWRIADWKTNSNQGATYNADYYWVKNQYARIVLANDKFNINDTYLWVPINRFKDGAGLILTNGNTRWSMIKFYPITDNCDKVDFLSVYTKEELAQLKKQGHTPTLTNYIARINTKNAGGDGTITIDSNTNVITVTTDEQDKTLTYYIVHVEPYERILINATTSIELAAGPNNFTIARKEVESRVYHCDSDCELTNEEIILNPIKNEDEDTFFFVPAKDTELLPATELTRVFGPEEKWTDINIHWYAENDIDTRTYTIAQIFDEDIITGTYSYLADASFDTSEFLHVGDTTITPTITINAREYTINEDEEIILNDTVHTKTFKVPFENALAQEDEAEITWDDLNVTISLTRLKSEQYDIVNMTNGEFWYFFHDRLDIADLYKNCALIETQLTSSWSQAYTASQYCQWFIPERWEMSTITSQNAWASRIFKVDDTGHVQLLTDLVPIVNLYKYNNETTFNGYLFHYRDNQIPCPQGEFVIDQVEILKDNPAIEQTLNHIFDAETSEIAHGYFTVQKYSERSYYYYVNGGIERKNLLHTLDPNSKVYPYYDGLYCMQLRILLSFYLNETSPAYEDKLNEKLNLWKLLYTRYPGIFLENVYENSNARSSKQLLNMAKLAFQDYSSPEKNYNITVIDAAALEGYEGQELHIGDGILIKTSDYYDAVDETYRALNQYLFISDISYNLRTDTDISLTVNPIKYQDKLLQSIVKLIR